MLKEVDLKNWLLHFTLREMHFLVGNYNTCILKATLVLPSAAKIIFPSKLHIELNSCSNPILEDLVRTLIFSALERHFFSPLLQMENKVSLFCRLYDFIS